MNIINTKNQTTIDSKYYKKYLKYKNKYLELKEILNGGTILDRCTGYDKSIFYIEKMKVYYQNYYPYGGFSKGQSLPNGKYPEIFNLDYKIEYNNKSDIKYISKVKFNYLEQDLEYLQKNYKDRNKIVPTVIKVDSVQTSPNKYNKYNKRNKPNRSEKSDSLNSSNKENTFTNSTSDPKIIVDEDVLDKNIIEYKLDIDNIPEQIINAYYHDNNDYILTNNKKYFEFILPAKNIFTSIIGKTIGLKCDDIVDTFYGNFLEKDISSDKKKRIVIIDFANLVNILPNINSQERYYPDKIKMFINNYLYNQCKILKNYVFIIFKPSGVFNEIFLQEVIEGTSPDYNLSYLLKEDNSDDGLSYLNIIGCGFSSINNFTEKKPSKIDSNQENWEVNNIQLFQGQLQSSIDDLIFWILTIFIYNVIYNFDKLLINNIILISNDTQSLDKENCDYFKNITNIILPKICKKVKQEFTTEDIIPNKNLLNIVFPNKCNNDLINSNYSIFLYSYGYTDKKINLKNGETILENTFYKTYDELLNRYINFIYNLFANTPLKLDPQLVINYKPTGIGKSAKNVMIKDYRTNIDLSHGQVNKVLNYEFVDNKIEDWNNLSTYVNLFETLLLNNINISNIRTDAIYFLYNYYPFEYFNSMSSNIANNNIGLPLQKKNFHTLKLTDFNKIHPGLFFYLQIKMFQKIKYGKEDEILSLEEIKKIFII